MRSAGLVAPLFCRAVLGEDKGDEVVNELCSGMTVHADEQVRFSIKNDQVRDS